MSLEQTYDTEIEPLMKRIIEIAKRARIPMYASFALDDGLACTTFISAAQRDLWPEARDWYAAHAHAAAAIGVDRRLMSDMTITTRDAGGNVKSVEVIHVAD